MGVPPGFDFITVIILWQEYFFLLCLFIAFILNENTSKCMTEQTFLLLKYYVLKHQHVLDTWIKLQSRESVKMQITGPP